MVLMCNIPCMACITARASGMGWAYVSVVDDASAVYWNPAIIPIVNNTIILGNMSEPYGQKYLIIKSGSIGFLALDEITDQYYKLATGKEILTNLYIGGSIEYGKTAFNEKSWNIDLSILYKFYKFNLGLLLQHIDDVRPSISWHDKNFTFAIDGYDILNKYDYKNTRLGFEYKIYFLSVRGGYEINQGSNCENVHNGYNLSYGIGLNFNKIKFDISTIRQKSIEITISL